MAKGMPCDIDKVLARGVRSLKALKDNYPNLNWAIAFSLCEE